MLSDLHTKINHENLISSSTGLLRHGHSDQFSYSSLNQVPGKPSGSSMLAAYPTEPYHPMISVQRGRVGYVKIDRSVLGKTSSDMRSACNKQPSQRQSHHSLRETSGYFQEKQRSVHPNNRPQGFPLIEPGAMLAFSHLLQSKGPVKHPCTAGFEMIRHGRPKPAT